jgi:bla regulator protein BlaR1
MPTQEFAASFGRLTANHLWQSTGFAAVAVLLALALRANHARARYWLWLAASVKFLVPFSALAAVGATLGRWLLPATPVSRFPLVMEQIVQPFAPLQYPALPVAASAPTASLLPALLLILWLCGFLAVLLYEWMRWRRVAAAVRSSTRMTEGREKEALWKVGQAIRLPTALRLVSSTAKLEPGVLGIFRPILWLPAGIGDRLDDAELESILAHELCHIRRRDNLFATLHMLVEAIFWFHPLVWWLGARLEEERERACDEEVVRMGGEPQIYAESILKVCEFYLASPVACAAGVTGGELKKRIEGIMSNPFTRKLSYGKKMLLASAAILAIAGPIAFGLLHPPPGRAQAQRAVPSAFEVVSVKGPLEQGGFNTRPTRSPGRFTWTTQLCYLLGYAYRLEWDRISGASGKIPG